MLLAREGNHRHLPKSIEASTTSGLERKIKMLQRNNKAEYRFISFYYDAGKNSHVAWYYTEITTQEEIKELVDGLTTE